MKEVKRYQRDMWSLPAYFTPRLFFSVFFGASVTLIRPDRRGERSENLSVGRWVDLYYKVWPTCWTQTFIFQMYNYVLGKGFHTKATTILKKGSGRKEEKTHVLAEVWRYGLIVTSCKKWKSIAQKYLLMSIGHTVTLGIQDKVIVGNHLPMCHIQTTHLLLH